mmetsp:Transcript_21822/g.39788  ORF Transcript_21822/g.39788 Transcript_21822/m.39788 type:complete len:129 (+) Transcript_21822:82-468(+)
MSKSKSQDPQLISFCTNMSATQSFKHKLLTNYFKTVRAQSLKMIKDRKKQSLLTIGMTGFAYCLLSGAYGVSVAYVSKCLKHSKRVSILLGSAAFTIDAYFVYKELSLKRLQMFDNYEHSIWTSFCTS